jgi:hypothetical protein
MYAPSVTKIFLPACQRHGLEIVKYEAIDFEIPVESIRSEWFKYCRST